VAISARDFVNVRYSKRVQHEDGSEYLVSCSQATTHPDRPVDDSLLRGETHCSGWKFSREGDGGMVVFISYSVLIINAPCFYIHIYLYF
jgi:hypothetical protein